MKEILSLPEVLLTSSAVLQMVCVAGAFMLIFFLPKKLRPIAYMFLYLNGMTFIRRMLSMWMGMTGEDTQIYELVSLNLISVGWLATFGVTSGVGRHENHDGRSAG